MSIVCCQVHKDRIDIASDSITVWRYTQSKGDNVKSSKLFQVNGMTIGCVGSCEESGLFHAYCITRKPKSPTIENVAEFITEFAEWKKKKIEKLKVSDSYIMIFEKHAFLIEGFYIDEILTYMTIGAGMD